MKNFNVLEYNQIYMSWIGIHSKHLNEPNNEFFKSIGTYYMVFNVISFTIVASAVFVYKNASNIELIAEPCLIVIAGFQVLGMFISVGLKMNKVKGLHIKLQEIVDKSKLN